MTTASSLLIDDPISGVRRFTLNRPASLNALTFAMLDELIEELEKLRFDLSVRVVVLTGTGRGFCSGHDRNDSAKDVDWLERDFGEVQRSIAIVRRIFRIVPALKSIPQVTIASVNGVAAALGMSLVLGCDMAIAAESAFFANGFRNTGGGGAEAGLSYLLPRAVGMQHAAELLLSSRRTSAAEAAVIGLVLRSVPDDELESETLALCRDIMEMPPLAVAQTKDALWASVQASGFESALDYEMKGQILSFQTEDAKEKRAANSEKRSPSYKNR
jgi:enoyl-CoA hydratase